MCQFRVSLSFDLINPTFRGRSLPHTTRLNVRFYYELKQNSCNNYNNVGETYKLPKNLNLEKNDVPNLSQKHEGSSPLT